MPRSKGETHDFGEIYLWDDTEGAWIKENDPTFEIRAQKPSSLTSGMAKRSTATLSMRSGGIGVGSIWHL